MEAVCERKSKAKQKELNVVWQPYENSSQEVFLSCPIFECLYEGTRGPGKSLCMLMDFAQFVGRGFGRHWKGIIFREEFERLDEIIDLSIEYFSQIFPGAFYNKSNHVWEFETGERLLFRYAKVESDYWKFHGKGYPFIGFDELTSWPDDKLYMKMLTVCRSAHAGMPRRFRATCNPYGIGHNWVKARFIDPAPAGIVIEEEFTDIFGKKQIRERVRVHGDIWENKKLLENDPEYIKTLEAQSETIRRAWLYGDWDIIAGGMFDDVWDQKVHVIEPFEIPKTWRIDRSFDWGSAKPYSVGWWAESDGCDIKLAGGEIRSTKPGDLFRIDELYGMNGKVNEGTREPNTVIARKTREVDDRYKAKGYRVYPGPADTMIFDVTGGKTIADEMAEFPNHITWTRANKGPGSRINGCELLRQRLNNSITKDGPGLFIFKGCRQFIRTVPVLPRDKGKPDDVDTDAEDHAFDETRYRISAKVYKFTSSQ